MAEGPRRRWVMGTGGRYRRPTAFCTALTVITVCAWSLPAARASAAAKPSVVYVSATAGGSGDGSRQAPFNSLSSAEAASGPGATIVVLPSPLSVAPLDGGIALKPYQTLIGAGPSVLQQHGSLTAAPRITNSSGAQNSGDAVTLARGDTVENLEIVNPYRGGIYGLNVQSARVEGNNISGANSSCTVGFVIYFPIPSTLTNGWAGIMVDADAGASSLEIENNYVHDAACSDGIDLRASGTATVRAAIDRNKVLRLAEGTTVGSVLGIGLQTRDSARLTATADSNSETDIGSSGADCEGLFTNQTGGTLVWTVDHNLFGHGIGGASCNGGEFFTGQADGTQSIRISDSLFYDDPGDMLEENNLGTGSTMNMTLDHVTVAHTTLATPAPTEPPIPAESFGSFTGHGFCMSQFSTGPEAVTNFRMIDSHFSDCLSDGIFAFYANLPGFGTGPGAESALDIENSSITNVGQYALHWVNYATLDRLQITAWRDTFANAHGGAMLGFDQAPGATTLAPRIDLGDAGSYNTGDNCILRPEMLNAETIGYNVTLQKDWWGTPLGPVPSSLSATDGAIPVTPFLQALPRGGCA